jgi:hypothetical protein
MNKVFLVIAIPLFIFTVACKKETSIVIQAQDYKTGDGSAYANLNFEVVEKYTPFQEEKSEVVYSGTLDENGHAAFTLKMNPKRNYVLGVEDPNNLCFGEMQQYYLKHEDVNNITFDFALCSYSKLIINNSNCFDANDKLVLYRHDDLGTLNGDIGWVHDGCAHWETQGGVDGDPVGYNSLPYGNVYYYWEVTKNSVTTVYYDTVYYGIGEFKTYEINY